MTDIVERLRSPANVFYEYAADNGAFLREAADEIERLRVECARYRAALNAISCQDADYKDDGVIWCAERARAALGEGSDE